MTLTLRVAEEDFDHHSQSNSGCSIVQDDPTRVISNAIRRDTMAYTQSNNSPDFSVFCRSWLNEIFETNNFSQRRRRRREGERSRISGETFWNGWPRPGNWEKRRLEKRLRITHTLPKSINKWGGGREGGIFLNIVSSLNTSATRSHPRISTGSEFYYLYIHLDCSVVVTLFPSKLPTSADDDLDDFENISKQ